MIGRAVSAVYGGIPQTTRLFIRCSQTEARAARPFDMPPALDRNIHYVCSVAILQHPLTLTGHHSCHLNLVNSASEEEASSSTSTMWVARSKSRWQDRRFFAWVGELARVKVSCPAFENHHRILPFAPSRSDCLSKRLHHGTGLHKTHGRFSGTGRGSPLMQERHC